MIEVGASMEWGLEATVSQANCSPGEVFFLSEF